MKTRHYRLTAIAALLAAWVATGLPAPLSELAAPSARAADVKIGVVDLRNLFDNYWETKKAESAIAIKRNTYKMQIDEKQNALTKLRSELEKIDAQYKDPTISEDKKKMLEKEGTDKLADFRKMQQELDDFARMATNDLRSMDERNSKTIIDAIRKVIDQKARENSYDLILDYSGLNSNHAPSVLYFNDRTDITNEVLKALNQNAPPVQPTPPAPPAKSSTTPEKAP
jgi:outer membrane protein